MVPFKPLLEALALPPANLPLFILIGLGLRAAGRRGGQARGARRGRMAGFGTWLAGLSFAGLIALGLPAVAGVLLASVERGLTRWQAPHGAPPQAIVILGGDMARGLPAQPGGKAVLRPGPLSFERLADGAALARRTGLPVLISGGELKPAETPISVVMGQALAKDFAIVPRWLETRSADTWQNAALSAPILRKAGIQSAYIVTSAWHMRRAMLAFRPTGLTVTAAPVLRDAWPGFDVWDFVPNTRAWQISYYALHEWVGCAYYALR
ncbi:MAG: YdcF family protein [Rhodospirillales bacterium]|nr:YdcF family protein [Rhodospirillales bacterium]